MAKKIRTIPESNSFVGIVDSLYFERTGQLKESVGQLSKEELLDFSMFLIGKLDAMDTKMDELQGILNKATGYAL